MTANKPVIIIDRQFRVTERITFLKVSSLATMSNSYKKLQHANFLIISGIWVEV